MIEQGFNYTDSTIKKISHFFKIKVEKLKRRKEKSLVASKKSLKKIKKRPREDSNSSVVESSEKCTEARHPSKKYCILHDKCSHSTDSCIDLRAMINKHN